MRNKTTLINTTLGLILVCSITGNIILFNSVSKANKTYTSIQSQLDKSKAQLKTLQVNADGTKYGNGWTEVISSQVPADPNKKLSTGLTLNEAKIRLQMEQTRCKTAGMSDTDTKASLTAMATRLGTTLDEVNRISSGQATAPSTTTAPTTSTGTKSAGTVSTGTTSTTGSSTVTATDKNGNGVEDSLEGVSLDGKGTITAPSTNAPNPFHTPGE